MKIVQIDLRNKELEVLVAENVNKQFGELIVQLLNQLPNSYRYVLKLDSYKLFVKTEN